MTGTPPYSEYRRKAIVDWLIANNIDPHDVPRESSLSVHTAETGKVIRHDAFVRENGRRIITDTYECKVEPREAPLIVEPPELWNL